MMCFIRMVNFSFLRFSEDSSIQLRNAHLFLLPVSLKLPKGKGKVKVTQSRLLFWALEHTVLVKVRIMSVDGLKFPHHKLWLVSSDVRNGRPERLELLCMLYCIEVIFHCLFMGAVSLVSKRMAIVIHLWHDCARSRVDRRTNSTTECRAEGLHVLTLRKISSRSESFLPFWRLGTLSSLSIFLRSK